MATIIQQLSDAQARITELEEIVKVSGEQVATVQSEIKAAIEAKVKAEAEAKTTSESNGKIIAEKDAAIKAEQVAHEATGVELAKAKRALANPAFADAAIVGNDKPASEGGIAPSVPPMTSEEAVAKYKAIADPKERAMFRKENWKILGISEEK